MEQKLLTEKLAKTEGVQRAFWKAMVPFMYCIDVAFISGSKFFVPNMVMAPLLWGLGGTVSRGTYTGANGRGGEYRLGHLFRSDSI